MDVNISLAPQAIPPQLPLWLSYVQPFTSVVTIIGGLLLAFAALRQSKSSSRQANTAAQRHDAQTQADTRRRITESFSRAVEQIANEKIEVRLGGIYTLEQISKESPPDYWTVIEILIAFLKENARVEPTEETNEKQQLKTDVAAIASVLVRRNWEREEAAKMVLDLSGVCLTGAKLIGVNLANANLVGIHMAHADLTKANFKDSDITDGNLLSSTLDGAKFAGAKIDRVNFEGSWASGVHFEDAEPMGCNFKNARFRSSFFERTNFFRSNCEQALFTRSNFQDAIFFEAHLEGAYFVDSNVTNVEFVAAHLQEAHFKKCDLTNANFEDAHLEGANLFTARGCSDIQFDKAIGDSKTHLPSGIKRPEQWPPFVPPPFNYGPIGTSGIKKMP